MMKIQVMNMKKEKSNWYNCYLVGSLIFLFFFGRTAQEIPYNGCFGCSFLRLQIAHSKTQEKKSLKLLAGSFASSNDELLPSEQQPSKNPDLVFKIGPSDVRLLFLLLWCRVRCPLVKLTDAGPWLELVLPPGWTWHWEAFPRWARCFGKTERERTVPLLLTRGRKDFRKIPRKTEYAGRCCLKLTY